MSSNEYNYPEITKGMGELSPALWKRWMSALRYYETYNQNRSAELSPEALHGRITDLEMHKPYFYAKLLRARVLDLDLYNPNTYAYAWVEVKPVSEPTDCCADCLSSRHDLCTEDCLPILPCCETHAQCLTFLNYQGYWNWWENTTNTSWGDTLPETGFETEDLTSNFNPLQYPCIKGNASATNCNPNPIVGGFPNMNTMAYTKPAMNLSEAFNTGTVATGVTQAGLGDFMMQAIGGGDTERNESLGSDGSYPSIPECWDTSASPAMPPCTQYEFPLKTTPIVLMHNIRESEGTFRQVFQEANSYDGDCVTC